MRYNLFILILFKSRNSCIRMLIQIKLDDDLIIMEPFFLKLN